MKTLFILLFSFVAMSASAQTFVDQVDGGIALVCTNNAGEWVCKPIPIEAIRELGFTEVEGLILINESDSTTDETIEVDGCEDC